MSNVITASQLARLRRCPGSQRLRHDDSDSVFSEAGRDKHAALQAQIEAGKLPDGLSQQLVPFDAECEVSFVYNVATCEVRRIYPDAHRNYPPAQPFEVFGTFDVVGYDDGLTVIGDWKSWSSHGAPSKSDQLLMGALAARALRPDPDSEGNALLWFAYTDDDGAITRVQAELVSAEYLDDYAISLRELYAEAAKPNSLLQSGEHCRYCPAYANCPRQQEALASVSQSLDVAPYATSAQLYELYKMAQLASKRLREILWARCAEAPQQLAVGELRLVQKEGAERVVDGDIAYQIAAKYSSNADAAFTRSTSKKALESLKIPKETRTQMLDEMRAAGALARKAGSRDLEEVL